MNALGLRMYITTIDGVINSPIWYDEIVKQGVSPAELQGTRAQLSHLDRAMLATPHEKLDALVAQHDAELTAHAAKFQGDWQKDRLAGFRDAQVFIGSVVTIFNAAGIAPQNIES